MTPETPHRPPCVRDRCRVEPEGGAAAAALFPPLPFDLVVVAASLGGPAVLRRIVGSLPADFPLPIVVVQHVGAHPSMLARLLDQDTRLAVRFAADGERLRPGNVYLAPPDRHLLVCRSGVCRLSHGPRVNFTRPAADPLFASAVAAVGARVLGVVLTGRLHDGAAGAAAIRAAGGVVLAQDPATCAAPAMPAAVLRRAGADLVLPPEALAAALVSLVMVRGVPALLGVGQGPRAA